MTRGSELARRAWVNARNGLGVEGEAQLDEAQASVYLKYLLLQRAQDAGDARPLESAAIAALVDELLAAPAFCAPLVSAALVPVRRAVAESALYRRRLADLARDALLSEPLSPETCLAPRPPDAGRLARMLPGDTVHAVVFSDFSLIAHELYPLSVDAFVRDSERFGRPMCNVVGVHEDWIGADGGLRRALFVDLDASPRLFECDLNDLLFPHTAQITRLDGDETARHAALARRLPCPLVNPSVVSARADDKLQAKTAMSRRGVEVPAGYCLGRGEMGLRADVPSAELVVKPRAGTDGRATSFGGRGPGDDVEEGKVAFEHRLSSCWEIGDALVETRCDGLLYRAPTPKGTVHTVSLRVNVCQGPGLPAVAESGYARIGPDEHTPAAGAAGVGGYTVALADVWDHLVPRRGDRSAPVRLDEEHRNAVLRAAESAVAPFGDLVLAGVDLVLDVSPESGRVYPVVLEVNSRPAGLGHSRFLDSGNPEPGVSLALWDVIERLGVRGDEMHNTRSRQPVTVSV